MSVGNLQKKKKDPKEYWEKKEGEKKKRDQGFLFPTVDNICTLDLMAIRDSSLYDFNLFQVKIKCLT